MNDPLSTGGAPPTEIGDNNLRELVRRLPAWLRADLSTTDAQRRERAEDALVAIILSLSDDQHN